ncbi:DUF4864 domain-containing protein [Arsenicitalea aurantiaca]|uniref:DUF4864 domain-containing protein n=1 Tax=Arsenicitalea aurantiaca TaxID=1783274 RepID=A0A433XLN7_9HYPH|nr:DUF4864 domain-containing protein [Arsenicitalea aurantiaca]RUT34997.1 DUF4864 domain-containing protein [Arsenicitalea aurantiaca]
MNASVHRAGVTVASLLVALMATPALAEEARATAWQAAITGQIQAFREGDAPAAFSYAAAGFQQGFSSPTLFYSSIIGSGYAPIRESRSHSFGPYQEVSEDRVLQAVRLVGTNQQLYEAVYQLGQEEDGWKVMGVQLRPQPGIGI